MVLYMMASQCYLTGRPEAAVRYNNAQMAMRGRRDEVPYDCQGWLGGGYVFIGQPERSVEWCRAELARGRDTYAPIRATLVITLTIAGSPNDAMVAADGLVDAAEATRNPHAISYALLAYGFAFRDTDPDRA